MTGAPDYHAWTHRPKALGGTDPVRVILSAWREVKVYADDNALDGNVDDSAKIVLTGDERFILAVTEEEDAKYLLEAQAYISTVSSSGDVVISLRNLDNAGVDMLSTPITIDQGDYTSYDSATQRVIDATNRLVHTGDRIAIDVDDDGTGAMGLGVILAFGIEVGDQGGAGPAGPTGPTGPAGGAIAVTQTTHGFSVGDVIRRDSTGAYELAQADDVANADVIGIVTAVDDANTFRYTNSGEVTGLAGISDGEIHYLSDTVAGGLTTTEPTISRPILIGTGTTTGVFISQGTGTTSTIDARENDSDITAAPRANINFLDGVGTSVNVVDDPGNDEVEVSFDVTTGGDPITSVFGAPDSNFEFDVSSLIGLTTLGTPDVVDANTTIPGHLFLRDNAATTTGVYFTPPSAPFTAITNVGHNIHSTNAGVGLFIGEGTPGVLEFMGAFNSPTGGAGTFLFSVVRYSNPTTYGGFSTSYGSAMDRGPAWFAIRVNSSSNVDYLYSFDGYAWVKLVGGRNPAITIASVGLFLNIGDTTDTSAVFDYIRLWNSALTFPGV